jgi:hypothetical protein
MLNIIISMALIIIAIALVTELYYFIRYRDWS